MQATRRARLSTVIKEELSIVVPRELKDPRIPSVTFTGVEVTQDGSHATVYVALFGAETSGNPTAMRQCLEGLTSASGFLRKHLAGILTIRHIPTLIFKEDKGLDNANRVYDLLKQLDQEKAPKKD